MMVMLTATPKKKPKSTACVIDHANSAGITNSNHARAAGVLDHDETDGNGNGIAKDMSDLLIITPAKLATTQKVDASTQTEETLFVR
jgi:hypothetical protein